MSVFLHKEYEIIASVVLKYQQYRSEWRLATPMSRAWQCPYPTTGLFSRCAIAHERRASGELAYVRVRPVIFCASLAAVSCVAARKLRLKGPDF
jgi:hypothetical protein